MLRNIRWARLASFASVVLVATLAVLVAGTAPAAAQAVDKVSVRVDWFHWHYHSPFFLGIEKGFYKDAGIELEVTEGKGSGAVTQLVGNKDDEFGFAAGDAVIRGVVKGIPIISVASIMPKGGQSMIALKSSSIKKPEDLKGKKIAYNPGGTQEALLPAFLAHFGLKESDLELVTIAPSAKQQVFMAGKVDAMMSVAWSPSQYERIGGARYFLYSDAGVNVVGYSIVTNPDLIRDNPDLVRRFVGATLKSWDYAKSHPEESLDALAKHSKRNAKPDVRKNNSQDFPTALTFVGPAVQGKPFGYMLAADWETTQKVLKDSGVIDKSVPVAKLINNDFVGD